VAKARGGKLSQLETEKKRPTADRPSMSPSQTSPRVSEPLLVATPRFNPCLCNPDATAYISDERRRSARALPIIAAMIPLFRGVRARETPLTGTAARDAVDGMRFCRAFPQTRAGLTKERSLAEEQAPGSHGP
jgi:hypothetical protein